MTKLKRKEKKRKEKKRKEEKVIIKIYYELQEKV